MQHTWAEIEHDRNYKFSGVLPTEIKRRFYLISGVLELIDREFDVLSDDIDEYIKMSKDKVSKGDYDMPLDSKTLEQYMIRKYSSSNSTNSIINNISGHEEVVNELLKFGFTTIQEIEDILTDDMIGLSTTYIGVLRNMMIIKDARKYFEEAFDGDWTGTDKKTVDYWNEKTNTNIGKYLKERSMIISKD